MKPDYIQQIFDAIGASTSAIGAFLTGSFFSTAKEIMIWAFHAAVRHNYAVALTNLLPLVLVACTIRPYLRFVKWGCAPNSEHSSNSRFYNREGLHAVSIILGIVMGVMFIWGIFGLSYAIPRIIAPEWSTTVDIIEAVKDLKGSPAASK